MPPLSIFHAGTAKLPTLYQYTKVGSNASTTSTTAAKYFANTKRISVMGLVSRSSMVPVRRSSLKLRMVTAGTKKRNTHGAM